MTCDAHKGIQVSIAIPDIASLGDDDMPAIAPFRDGRWSSQTKELLVQFGTQKLDLNRGWASTWTELRIPEDRPTHSDNMRPPVPGYSPTFDALP
jgi:hypothetical protein